jgi:predicted N-formylglutamate amidohydrolase
MREQPSTTITAPGCFDLLAADEPPPFSIEREHASSPFVLTVDHASRHLPRALGNLGLPEAELSRHIAWDLGIAQLARRLSARLDAFAILHGYSRLAIDVNRPPGTPESIVTKSEATEIPGNVGLTAAARAARERALFWPYHARIRAELDRRATLGGRPTVLIALHSFTPSYLGVSRPIHVGVLYQRDVRFGHALLSLLREEGGLVVGDNQPYSVSDETDYGIPVHGEQRGIAHVELELRQDLIEDEAGCERWAARLARLLERAHANLFPA